MLNAIIIDDEAKSRRTLQRLVENYCPSVTVVATAIDIPTGIEAIHLQQPDLVFLDIELPNYNGFKIFELLDNINFKIIFTTAYEQYAHKAFKVAAEDYLLKPIDIDDLILAVKKVENAIFYSKSNLQLEHIKKGLAQQNQLKHKYVFPSQEGLIFLQNVEILYLEAVGRNTKIHTKEQEIITSKSLKACKTMLHQRQFYQVHRSYIINLEHVFKYVKGRNSYIIMDNNLKIDIGNNFKDGLLNALSAGYIDQY